MGLPKCLPRSHAKRWRRPDQAQARTRQWIEPALAALFAAAAVVFVSSLAVVIGLV